MSHATKLSHGVMEGQGAYNKYAKLPAGGVALAMPLLEKAVHGHHKTRRSRAGTTRPRLCVKPSGNRSAVGQRFACRTGCHLVALARQGDCRLTRKTLAADRGGTVRRS